MVNMKAVVCEKPGGPEVLIIKELPIPQLKPGCVLIKVKAFGLNRSEMYTRQGHSPDVKFPRVLGIECVGIVENTNPGSKFSNGQKVAAIMGEMGRAFDGGYAEYALLPEHIVFPFDYDLDWATLGAIPEMFQTAYGSLYESLEIKKGETLLVRGATSSVGMAATRIAKNAGLTVLGTTRSENKTQKLEENGVDYTIIDDGDIVKQVREIYPQGVNKVLELVGTATLLNSLRCVAKQGTVCMTGILGNSWTLPEFQPMGMIPPTVKLTCYGGDINNINFNALKQFAEDLKNGKTSVNIDRVFNLDEIVEAHEYMENNKASGKLVVVND